MLEEKRCRQYPACLLYTSSSHILSEVSAICDYVLIISHGKLVASDTPENLGKLAAGSNNLNLLVKGQKDTIRAALELSLIHICRRLPIRQISLQKILIPRLTKAPAMQMQKKEPEKLRNPTRKQEMRRLEVLQQKQIWSGILTKETRRSNGRERRVS